MPFEIDFGNPKKLPLHELSFHVKDNGVKVVVPALDKKWVDERPHPKYLALSTDPMQLTDENVVREWLTEAEWFNKEIEWMLSLEHYRFWSYLVHDPACISSIVSFLQEAKPSYIPIRSLTTDDHIVRLYSNILQNVLSVLCRMVTNKESETEWISKEHLSELLYDKFLFSVPMLFDILVVYGRSNETILRRLIETIVKIQAKYQSDLIEGLTFLATTFDTIQKKINENDADTFDDVALYTLDCAYTIHTLLIVFPDSHAICRNIKLEQSVTHFYDNAIPMLYKHISLINQTSIGLRYLNHARMELIGFFRRLVNYYLLDILTEPNKSVVPAETFLGILQEALTDHSFVIDYQRLYPVQNDVDILKQACSDLDTFKVDFIVEAFTAENEEFLKTFVDQIDIGARSSNATSTVPNEIDDDKGGCSKPLNPLTREVQKVLDVLPHLDSAFVCKLLARYENTELAIAAVLEGNLPPDLDDNIDVQSPVTGPEKSIDGKNELINALNQADFGIDANTKVISKSAKPQPIRQSTEKRFLDDKSHIKDLHTRYVEYGYITDDYDDEYDDSYDALTESETKSVTKILKRTGAINDIPDEIDDSEESDSNEELQAAAGGRDSSHDFCENPEAARERWAQNRQAKFSNKQPSKATGNMVVGNPKGQGQEKNTLVSRHKKDVNKSSRANHNRRQGAAFKRNKGMIPS